MPGKRNQVSKRTPPQNTSVSSTSSSTTSSSPAVTTTNTSTNASSPPTQTVGSARGASSTINPSTTTNITTSSTSTTLSSTPVQPIGLAKVDSTDTKSASNSAPVQPAGSTLGASSAINSSSTTNTTTNSTLNSSQAQRKTALTSVVQKPNDPPKKTEPKVVTLKVGEIKSSPATKAAISDNNPSNTNATSTIPLSSQVNPKVMSNTSSTSQAQTKTITPAVTTIPPKSTPVNTVSSTTFGTTTSAVNSTTAKPNLTSNAAQKPKDQLKTPSARSENKAKETTSPQKTSVNSTSNSTSSTTAGKTTSNLGSSTTKIVTPAKIVSGTNNTSSTTTNTSAVNSTTAKPNPTSTVAQKQKPKDQHKKTPATVETKAVKETVPTQKAPVSSASSSMSSTAAGTTTANVVSSVDKTVSSANNPSSISTSSSSSTGKTTTNSSSSSTTKPTQSSVPQKVTTKTPNASANLPPKVETKSSSVSSNSSSNIGSTTTNTSDSSSVRPASSADKSANSNPSSTSTTTNSSSSVVKDTASSSSSSQDQPSSSPSHVSAALLLFNQFNDLNEEEKQEFLRTIRPHFERALDTEEDPEIAHNRSDRSNSIALSDTSEDSNKATIEIDNKIQVSKAVITELGQDKILLKVDGREVHTNVSSRRDGDHLTALVVLKEIIYNFVQGKTYEEMEKDLSRLLIVLDLKEEKDMSGKILGILQEREKFFEKNNLSTSRETRKKLTKSLRQRSVVAEKLKGVDFDKLSDLLELNDQDKLRFKEILNTEKTLSKEEIRTVKELMKYGEKAANASTISAIVVEIISALNQQVDPPTAIPDRGPKAFHERKESEAVRGIKLFILANKLTKNYEDSKDPEQKKAVISDFKDKAKEAIGYNDLTGTEKFKESFGIFMREFVGAGEDIQWIAKMKEQIDEVNFSGRMRDGKEKFLKLNKIKKAFEEYDQDNKLETLKSTLYKIHNTNSIKNIQNNFNDFIKPFLKKQSKEVKSAEEKVGISNDQWVSNIKVEIAKNKNTIVENIGKAFNELFDFAYVPHTNEKLKENDLEILYKSCARHICYMFNAFDGLKELKPEIKDKIIDNFLTYVLEVDGKNQGWKQAMVSIFIDNEDKLRNLDLKTIKSEVGKYVDLQNHDYKLNFNKDNQQESSQSI